MRLSPFCAALFFAAAIASAPAFAADPAIDRRATEIVELRDRTPEQAKAVIDRLSDSDKDTLVREQDTIDRLLAVTPDPQAMTSVDRETLWNSTKIINSLIEGDRRVAEQRLICRQERKIGSTLPKRNCRTQGELDEARRRAIEDLDRSTGVQIRRD